MESTTFLFIYLLCNAFRAYILYLFFKIFFTERKTSERTEILSYVLFFFVNSLVYYVLKIPVLNLFVNIAGFFLLTFNYKGSLIKRCTSVFLVYLTMVCVEIAAAYFFSNARVNVFIPNTNEFIYIPIATTITLYIISLLLLKLKSIRKQVKIPVLYWVMLAGIPVSSLYMLVLLLQTEGIRLFSLALCATLVLFINFSVFYLYDRVIAELSAKMEKELLEQENIFYNRQLDQMQTALSATRKMQHDIRNHWTAITLFAENNNNKELLSYMKEIQPSALQSSRIISTGNTSIDSILNYKIQEASQFNIQIHPHLQIPKDIPISAPDCVIILGNLLDNAIQATKEYDGKRTIDFVMKYNAHHMILIISNPFSGKIKTQGTKILSSKKDKQKHGFGIANVKTAVEKYHGSLDITHENNTFKVIISLYVN